MPRSLVPRVKQISVWEFYLSGALDTQTIGILGKKRNQTVSTYSGA